jgi:hypothetical protein
VSAATLGNKGFKLKATDIIPEGLIINVFANDVSIF